MSVWVTGVHLFAKLRDVDKAFVGEAGSKLAYLRH